MIDWKWVPKWSYLVAVFRGVFSRSVLWVFTGFKPFGDFWKKSAFWDPFLEGRRTQTRGVSDKCGKWGRENTYLNGFHTKARPKKYVHPPGTQWSHWDRNGHFLAFFFKRCAWWVHPIPAAPAGRKWIGHIPKCSKILESLSETT